jgi:tetratricopeptide (TPR) repeat protein
MKNARRPLLAIALVAALGAGLASPAFALSDGARQQLDGIQARWAEVNYKLPDKQREAAFAELSQQAAQAVATEPAAAELHIWHGIVLSTYAGAKGGLGALDLVKKARTELEEALKLDPKALDGSAYTSLGSLYYQVPGWPLGFGDDAKAETLLKQALAINPDGIDPNYFYGDFLLRNKRYAQARPVLEKALAAPDRPGRAMADEGRRGEIRQRLKEIESKL